VASHLSLAATRKVGVIGGAAQVEKREHKIKDDEEKRDQEREISSKCGRALPDSGPCSRRSLCAEVRAPAGADAVPVGVSALCRESLLL
jgi:hypothetical protein